MSDVYDKPTDQVEVEILVGSKGLQKEYPAIKVEVEKKINDIPKASVHLISGDPTQGNESFKSAEGVKVGDAIEIKAGYKTQTESIFKGIISGKNTEHDKSGNPTMIIECIDKTIALQKGKNTAYFNDKTDAEIITSILSDASLEKSITIDSKVKFEQLVQFKSNDWDFIQKRAQINGCILVPNDNKLTVAKPDLDGSPIRTLEYGKTIKEHSIEVSDKSQPKKVSARCWDPSQQKLLKATATEPTINEQGASGKNNDPERILHSSNFMEQGALKAWADGYLLSLRLSRIRGRINTQGDAKLKPDTILELKGTGKDYNGKGYIGSIKHTILPGDWETELELGLPEKFFDKESEALESRVTKFKGLQIGIVKQIHEDPEKAYRVLVTIPSIPEIKDGIWARLGSPYALKEKGWFFYPEVGDELILGFVEGHPSHAIILGSLYSKKNTAPYKPDKDNSTKAIVTKSELKIEFNDKDKITTISTPKENKIVLNDKDEKIIITDKKKNVITLSKDGIVIESKGKMELKAAKDVTIKGKNIKIEATSKLDLAGKDIKMKAKMALDGEGLDVSMKAKKAILLEGKATADLKASGKASVKGAILKLN